VLARIFPNCCLPLERLALSKSLLESLTPAQREAVEYLDGPLLILAGPGSGKTRVITHRIANLLAHGVPARQILALTFTNKAADEMRRRIDQLAPSQPVWMSTFHRFCARLLRQYAAHLGLSENYTIYDMSDQRQTLKRVLQASDIDTTHFTPDRIAHAISWAKNHLLTPELYLEQQSGPVAAVVARIYPAYQQQLLAANAVDFDDLLLHVANLLRESSETRALLDARYRYILVDEYQDTNTAQYAIVKGLSIDHQNLAVTGDPDQSIYGWRGANLNNILEFEHDFPNVKIVKLERNYRSTKSILRVADQLIGHNVRRKQKRLYTENEEGRQVALIHYLTQQDEADSIAAYIDNQIRAGRRAQDFAVFYRVNALSRAIEFAMREHGIPYQMVNGLEFYQRKEIKDVLGYLRLMNNPRDDVAFTRIINNPPRKIGKATIDRLGDHADRYHVSMLDAARECGLIEGLNKRAAAQVMKFVGLYDRLALQAAAPVEEILGHVLIESGYRQMLADSDDEDDQERLANIEELLTAARQFDELHPVSQTSQGGSPLEAFLEQSSLVADTDAWDTEVDRVTLMTLHAAKGLEFPVVFIMALEEGLLPHERSRAELKELEEERRLLFVGITRAQQELQLSLARNREFRGQRRMTVPSQFLMELPREEMRVVEPRWMSPSDDEWLDHHDGEIEPAADETDAMDELTAFFASSLVDEAGEPEPVGWAPAHLPINTADKVGGSPPYVLPLTTAAELHAEPAPDTRPRVSPEVFALGMLVKHPDFGLGKIVALGGGGAKRQATVAFASSAGERKFMLIHSNLRPAVEG
jgi:DNA helicase-2/ATP-dependent DNA helicase PcrA